MVCFAQSDNLCRVIDKSTFQAMSDAVAGHQWKQIENATRK